MKSAKIAASTMARMTATPAAPSGLVRINFQVATQMRWLARRTTATVYGCEVARAISLFPLAIADSGIEPGIEQVDEQIDKHKGKGDEQHQGLHHRDVTMGNGVDHETAETIQGKDGFGHHQPTDKKSNFRADNRDDWQE